jgi:hypothetical protein
MHLAAVAYGDLEKAIILQDGLLIPIKIYELCYYFRVLANHVVIGERNNKTKRKCVRLLKEIPIKSGELRIYVLS